ncbi:hypothetical protein [Agitococcus lubricus]|uniref:Uncharacterized protein n=1 Tax=Agitococcus lubricus TaxID=1077255 RepID=A0A2T5J0C4_9GAMM|nr:hypothetical protein [Agitococcus lubricus]PTQ89794.1 hypothetical protein C8N29_105119 [Agitococcus lubricus]
MITQPKVHTFPNLVEAAREKNFGKAVTIEIPAQPFGAPNAQGDFEVWTDAEIEADARDFARRLKAAFM